MPPISYMMGAGVVIFTACVIVARMLGGGTQPPNTWRIRSIAGGRTGMGVLLEAAGENRIQVLKALREASELGLAEAKQLVDSAPTVVARGLEPTRAERLRQALMAEGARARLATGDELAEFEVVLHARASTPASAMRTFCEATGSDLAEAHAFVAAAPGSAKRLPLVELERVEQVLNRRGDLVERL